jgi:hypothetical protein
MCICTCKNVNTFNFLQEETSSGKRKADTPAAKKRVRADGIGVQPVKVEHAGAAHCQVIAQLVRGIGDWDALPPSSTSSIRSPEGNDLFLFKLDEGQGSVPGRLLDDGMKWAPTFAVVQVFQCQPGNFRLIFI